MTRHPDGPDDQPGNADDDFRLQPGSPCINLGANQLPGGLPSTVLDGSPRIACSVVDMGACEAAEPTGGCSPVFLRGDSDGDGRFVGLVDGIHILAYQFAGGPTPPCLEAADADGDGEFVGLADGLYALAHQFLDGPPPGAPYPNCGSDPDPVSSLGCDSTSCP